MVPKGWEVTILGACVDLMQSGLSRKLSNEDIGLPVIRSGNMEDVETNFDDLKYWYTDDPQGADTSVYVLQDEDILVNFINSLSQIGKACIYRNKINRPCIYTTNILRIKANAKIDNNYLFCQTKTSRYDKYVQSITKPAVNQASFTTKEFKMFEFLLPPLPEQRKIAQILSTWDKAINTTERLLTNRQQQKKALMQRLLTGKQRFAGFEGEWKCGTLNDLATIDTGFAFKSVDFTDSTDSVPIIRMSDFKAGGLDLSSPARIPISLVTNMDRFALRDKDFVFGMSGSLSNYAWVKSTDLPCFLNQRVGRIAANSGADQMFVTYLYLSEQVQQDIIDKAAGAAQLNISVGDLRNTKVKYPSIKEQQKIASVLSAADTEITTIQNQLDNLKQQKKALMQQLLTGKRRVKV